MLRRKSYSSTVTKATLLSKKKLWPDCPSELTLWLLRALYQLCLITCLTLFFSVCLWVEIVTLDPFHPRQNVTSNPGLGFRPAPTDPYTTLVQFQHGNGGNWKPLEKSIRSFVRPYGHGKFVGSHIKCRWHTHIDRLNRCHVSKRRWIDWSTDVACTKAEHYGYARGRPCVLLKMSRLYGWEPEPYYNVTEVRQIPDMPNWLKSRIEHTWETHCEGRGEELEAKCPQLRMVWLSCTGDTPADVEYMGKLHYTPLPGIQGYYFPYLNQQNYLSPVVWIQFRDLTPGVLINVSCKLWAKNILHDPNNSRVGGVHFEMLMD